MKKKSYLVGLLPLLSFTCLVGCGGNNNSYIDDEEEEERVLEIGDTVKEWKSVYDSDELPIGALKEGTNGTGTGEIVNDFGNEDKSSISFTVKGNSKGEGYLGSDAVEIPYFLEEDAKNGDIVSLYVYAPANSNLASVKLQLMPSSMRNPVEGTEVAIGEENEEKWMRVVASFDTLETLGAIRLVYKTTDAAAESNFYVDDINITLGAETVETDYVDNEESLYKTYEPYFKVGACMSSNMLRNTTIRKIAKNDFNSLTAENEGKPEQILDQKACQELVKTNSSGVAITIKPFEKLYDFCEANHIGVRHHTFVWYSQTPAWFFTKDYTNNGQKADRVTMLQRMENFIRETLDTINDRWPGLVYAVDVANEAVENGGLRTNNNNWYTTVGEDFVYYAFKYAHEYKAEGQQLFYNDYSFDYQPNYCKFALNNVLNKAIDEGLIDGVGIQGHLDSNANLNNVMTDAKMICEKGLECQITELDITINGNNDANLAKQKDAYKNMVKLIMDANLKGETNITALVVWGINDNASWKSSQYPLLYTSNYGKKPAYYGFLEAINEVELPSEEIEE